MRYLKTSEAAALLNVSPNTLRAWERRFGYPKPQRSPGKHRLYTYGEVAALNDALQEGLSISSAVSRAREGLTADANSLSGALSAFDRQRADGAMEAALALRSLERSVEEVLLPSLADVEKRHGLDSARWAFAGHWADEWLRWAQRLAPATSRGLAVLVGNASGGELDPDTSAIRAFELFVRRSGVEVLCLSVQATNDLGEALTVLRPDAVIVVGRRARDDEVARWAYAVRSAAGALPVTLFRREVGRPLRARTTGARHLSASPSEAQGQLLELIESAPFRTEKAEPASPTRLVPRTGRAS